MQIIITITSEEKNGEEETEEVPLGLICSLEEAISAVLWDKAMREEIRYRRGYEDTARFDYQVVRGEE